MGEKRTVWFSCKVTLCHVWNVMETGEILSDWGDARGRKCCTCLQRGQKESRVNYGLLSLTSVPGKMMEQVLLEDISRSKKENRVMWNSQHGFTKGEWCLTNVITFYDKMSGFVGNERAQDTICLDFSKTFDSLLQCSCALVRILQLWVVDNQTSKKKWLGGPAQKVSYYVSYSTWRPVISVTGVCTGSGPF